MTPALSFSSPARYFALSSGEHRRLLIAEALAARPRILVLDEPFDGLDAVRLGYVLHHPGSMGCHNCAHGLLLVALRFALLPPLAPNPSLLTMPTPTVSLPSPTI